MWGIYITPLFYQLNDKLSGERNHAKIQKNGQVLKFINNVNLKKDNKEKKCNNLMILLIIMFILGLSKTDLITISFIND